MAIRNMTERSNRPIIMKYDEVKSMDAKYKIKFFILSFNLVKNKNKKIR